MVIAVDIRFSDAYQHFIFETFKRITAQHPEHSFLFIFDKPFNAAFIFSENVITEVIKQTRIQLLSKLNNEMKISSLLQKYKAGVFITQQPMKINVPQCFIAFEKLTAGYVKKAKVIIVDSQFKKKQINETYKIDVVYKGTDDVFQPLSIEERETVKEEYAAGNEYFLVAAANHSANMVSVLKAFSVFKKMQKSNMLLLILSPKDFDKEFLQKLESFKYKSEVSLLQVDKYKAAAITAASYAFLQPFQGEEYLTALQAMKCNVPVITADEEVIAEVCGDAAMYTDPQDHKQIAEKMMLVYKDENLRISLIEKGKQLVKKYSWDVSANAFWRSIVKTF